MKTTKDKCFMELINNNKLYHNRSCYRHLERKEKIAVFFIIKHLKNHKSISKSQLFPEVKEDFNKWVDKKADIFRNKKNFTVDNIKSHPDLSWIIRRTPKKEVKWSYLSIRHFGRIIDYLTPLFINLRTTNVNNPGMAHIISINRNGKELWKKWQEKMKLRRKKSKEETTQIQKARKKK